MRGVFLFFGLGGAGRDSGAVPGQVGAVLGLVGAVLGLVGAVLGQCSSLMA